MGNPTELVSMYLDKEGKSRVGPQQAVITAANVSHSLSAIFSDTEVEAALDALGVKINLCISSLENLGANNDS